MTLEGVKALLSAKPGPYPVAFEMMLPDGTAGTLQSQCRVRPDAALIADLEEILGAGSVELVVPVSGPTAANGAASTANTSADSGSKRNSSSEDTSGGGNGSRGVSVTRTPSPVEMDHPRG
jgi:hypothetical protein